MNTRRRHSLSLLIGPLAAVLVSACSNAERVITVKLNVSETGAYTLEGSPVPKEELKHALRARRPENGSLLLHVNASPSAPFEAVGQAMQAAQFAGAQVAFVGNERF